MLSFKERGVEFTMPNGRIGDPLIYAFNYRTGDAFLFDLGNLDRVPQKNILKVQKIFVTHTHIDHFIGFDRLLRVNIPHKRQLEFVGPVGIVANIEGKLAGYVWNLLERHQLRFIIHEIASDQKISSHRLQFENTGFKRSFYQDHCHEVVSSFRDGAKIKATIVDHGIPVVTYRLFFPPKYQVQVDKLAKHGFKTGPWLKKLQTAIATGNNKQMIAINNREQHPADWLATRVLQSYPEFSVSYLTDLRFTWDNLRAIKKLHHKTSILFCESTFAERDRQRATEKAHLSTKQCAMVAAYSEARHLENFHFSSIYGRIHIEQLRREALNHFNHYRRLNRDFLEQEINAEIDKCRSHQPANYCK